MARKSRPMTEKQWAVLDAIATFKSEHGFPPSLAEIAQSLGIQASTAQGHVDRLIRKGHLDRQTEGESRRTLTIVSAEWQEKNGDPRFYKVSNADLKSEMERRGYTVKAKARRKK